MNEQHQIHTEPIEAMIDKLNVETIFGKAINEGGATIIPIAQVTMGFGYGGGYGRGPNGAAADTSKTAETPSAAEGSGSGGGGGGRATPCGYLRITPEGVKYEPIVDVTRVPLAVMLMAAWSVFWVTATVRSVARSVARRKKAG